MSDFPVPKSPERLNAERAQIEELTGPELYQIPEREFDPDIFRARNRFAADALSLVRRGIPEQFDSQETHQWIAAANALQEYVAKAEDDPDSSFLRPGQIPLMRSIANFFEIDGAEHKGGHATIATSVGKTVLFTELVHATGMRGLVVVPTKHLVMQTYKRFKQHANERHLDIGLVYDEAKMPGKDVTITTYASLNRQIHYDWGRVIFPEEYPLVIYDEVHELLGEKYSRAVQAFPHAMQVGFTASDKYSDEKQVANILPHKIVELDIIEAQNQKLVAPHQTVIIKTHADMRKVYVASTGEYAQDVLFQTINTDERNQAVIDSYKALFPGKKGIAYCAGIKHAHHLAAKMRENGIAAEAVDGTMSVEEREEIIARLRLGSINGGIDMITNDRVLGVGFDDDTIEVALLVAPMLSFLKLLQNAGRVPRLLTSMPGKVGYIAQYIDDNYSQPPALYAEKRASGYARHGWEGFEFPELSIEGIDIPGVDIITSPEEIQQLAERHTLERDVKLVPLEPPEEWSTLNEIAEKTNRKKSRVSQALNRFIAKIDRQEAKLIEEGEPTDHLFDYNAHRGKYRKPGSDPKRLLYISPELSKELREYISEYELVPSPLWRTPDQIAALYGMTSTWVKLNLTSATLRSKYPELWGKYVPDEESGRVQNFFSPEYISSVVAEHTKRMPDYSRIPPETWRSEEEIIAAFGPEAYEIAQARFTYRIGFHALDGRLNFSEDEPRILCSPSYARHLEYLLFPENNLFWRGKYSSIDTIANGLEQFGITTDDLEHEIDRVVQKEPGLLKYQCGKYYNSKLELVYYCNDRVSAHIREQAIRAKVEKRVENERELLGILATKEAERAESQAPAEDIPPATPLPKTEKSNSARKKVKKQPPSQAPKVETTPGNELEAKLNQAMANASHLLSLLQVNRDI